MKCVFCNISQQDSSGQIEYKYEHSFVITPLNPVTIGHKLIIPYCHLDTFMESPLMTGRVFEDAANYAADHFGDNVNLITSAGRIATQTVGHLHVHVIPRRRDDGLQLPWA